MIILEGLCLHLVSVGMVLVGIGLVVGLVAAAWPAWKMSRIDIVAGLRHVA